MIMTMIFSSIMIRNKEVEHEIENYSEEPGEKCTLTLNIMMVHFPLNK